MLVDDLERKVRRLEKELEHERAAKRPKVSSVL